MWLVLGVVLVVAVLVGLLLARSRRRAAWARLVEADEQEAAWFARELVPELRRNAGSAERLAGAWSVAGADRVRRLEDSLTAHAATSPDDVGRVRTSTLRDAVREARERLDALAGPLPPASPSAELDAVAAGLEAALARVTPPGRRTAG
ncbi:hypothetical protein [Nocardioides sp.]|uniref:hypothetical protein n=1 Tax=Nocardioides sp. TaxID=35761 RepID=UPI0037830023